MISFKWNPLLINQKLFGKFDSLKRTYLRKVPSDIVGSHWRPVDVSRIVHDLQLIVARRLQVREEGLLVLPVNVAFGKDWKQGSKNQNGKNRA